MDMRLFVNAIVDVPLLVNTIVDIPLLGGTTVDMSLFCYEYTCICAHSMSLAGGKMWMRHCYLLGKGSYVFGSVGLFVCLFVSLQHYSKIMNGLR